MVDVFSKRKRSQVMSKIRSSGNASTELTFARELRLRHISGWRRHLLLPGKPDFTFKAQRVCVFLHGCFWHGCPKCYKAPSGNSKYWTRKLNVNQDRDKRVVKQLRNLDWKVLTVWECQLIGDELEKVIYRLNSKLKKERERLMKSVAKKKHRVLSQNKGHK
jgi:DNA mismatch endonuclease (patch repair protein)